MKPHTSISVPARPFLQGRPGTWPALVAVLTLLAGAPPDRGLHAQMVPDAPIEDFRLPMFDDDQGYRAWDLRGDQALYLSADRIDVIGMRLRVFAGGPEERIRMTIVSPEAHVLADRNEARGEDGILVTGDNYRAEGTTWTWERDNDRVRISGDVRVTFREEFEGFLMVLP